VGGVVSALISPFCVFAFALVGLWGFGRGCSRGLGAILAALAPVSVERSVGGASGRVCWRG